MRGICFTTSSIHYQSSSHHPRSKSMQKYVSKSGYFAGAHIEEGFTCAALGAKHEHLGGDEDELEERGKEGEPGSQAEAEVNSIGGLALLK